jgi:nucleoside 2-deoxyribosyltransferase
MMKVYVAGPLFSDQDRTKLEKIAVLLNKLGLKVYLPHKNAGDLGTAKKTYGKQTTRDAIFERDVQEIARADLLIALLDGPDVDSGTAMEIGMAYQLSIPVYALKTDFFRRGRVINNMIWGACNRGRNLCYRTNDLLTLVKKEVKRKKDADRK